MAIASRSNYVETLDEAWRAHLAPRAVDALTVISLFAGCGGSSLGYSMVGYRELLAVEWDDHAVATFRLNFPEVPVYHGDIAALSVDEALRLSGLSVGELDVLDGSPPCQGFSTVGKRHLHDARNSLFREYVRLLDGLKPRSFVMENVSGMVKGKMKLVFVECLRELKAVGYRVSARLLNAMYFDVPQHRERIIFVGVRDDLEISTTHPAVQSRPIAARDLFPSIKRIREGWGPHESVVIAKRNDDFANKWRSADLPCCTICKTRPPIALLNNGMQRELTVEECARFASFPSLWQWIGTAAQRINCIGNSVPPLFMRAIAQHIRDTILTAQRMTTPAEAAD